MVVLIAGQVGCVSKKRSKSAQQSAYALGRQQGYVVGQETTREEQQQEPVVHVSGNVRQSIIEWNEELTLSQTIVAAQYSGKRTPSKIFVHRGQDTFQVLAWQLLRGDDFLLEPGDHVELRER